MLRIRRITMVNLVDRIRGLFAEKPTEAPEMGQVSVVESLVGQATKELWNDDSIIRTKGMSYLRSMSKKNAVVGGVLRSRKSDVIGLGYDVVPGGDDPRDVEIADFVRAALDHMTGRFEDDLRELWQAVPFGYALQEIIWEPWRSGQFGDKWAPLELKALKQENFRFVVDKFGNVTSLKQVQPQQQDLDPEKFIVAKYEGDPGDPHGESLLSSIFWPDWFMREGTRFWAVYLERFGMPTLRITHPRSAQQGTVDKAKELVDEIQSAAGLVMSADLEAEFLEATRGGQATYDAFLGRQSDLIRERVLGQTLTSSQGKVGSQALGEVHRGEKEKIVDDDAEWLCNVVNEQLVRRMVEVNFGSVDSLPKLTPTPRKDEHLGEKVEVLEGAARMGIRIPLNWAHEELGIPQPKGDEETLQPRATPDPVPPTPDDGDEDEPQQFAEWSDEAFWRELTRFEDGPTLRGIRTTSTDLVRVSIDEARGVWTGIRDDLIGQAEAALEAGSQAVELAPNMKAFTDVVRRQTVVGQLYGRVSAIGELNKRTAPGAQLRQFASELPEVMNRFAEFDALPTLDEAREWLGDRVAMPKAEFDRIDRAARQKAFFITTMEGREAVSIVYRRLNEALEQGWGIGDFRRAVEADYTGWIGDLFGKATSTQAMAESRLATAFRTNIMTALGRGREKVFKLAEDPLYAADPVVAYQYSAVLDGRQRKTHEAMDGRIYPKGHYMLVMWRTPNGYNCRCMWVPIMESQAAKMDATELSTTPPVLKGLVVEPDKGFGKTDFADVAWAA